MARSRPMRSVLGGLLLFASMAHAQVVQVDRLAAIVAGKPILRSQVLERLKPLLATAKTPDEQQGLFLAALDELIDDELIAQDADAMRVEVSTEEVERALNEVAASNKITFEELAGELAKQGFTLKSYRQAIRQQLVAMRWLQRKSNVTRSEENGAQFSKLLDQERRRLVGVLRSRAAIEVLP